MCKISLKLTYMLTGTYWPYGADILQLLHSKYARQSPFNCLTNSWQPVPKKVEAVLGIATKYVLHNLAFERLGDRVLKQ